MSQATTQRTWVGASAITMAAAVRERQVSAADLVRAHLDHLAEVEHRLGAFVSVRRAAAIDEAEHLDARSDLADLPLAGVPIAVKDNVDLAGEPTRLGSQATAATAATADHEVVARLRAAGAIPIGKTRCPELCAWGTSDDPAGTSVSPWDPSRSAGGSSGGSAAAVAAGVVPVAVATDGLGSIRIPAAACGLVGIKPGGDLLPEVVDGAPHWFGISRHGPLATTVADTALVLDVMAGTRRLRDVARPAGPLQVAVSWGPPLPGVVIARPWVEAAIEAGRLLRSAGHGVTGADPAYEPATAGAVLARWAQGVAADVDALGLDPARLQPRTVAHAALGRALARRVPVTDAQARRWQERLGELFDHHDVLVLPTLARDPLPARAWYGTGWVPNLLANLTAYPLTGAFNLADVPVAAVPMWHHRGRPLSVQVVAAPGREDLVLSVAAELERLRHWTRHAPGWGVPTSTPS